MHPVTEQLPRTQACRRRSLALLPALLAALSPHAEMSRTLLAPLAREVSHGAAFPYPSSSQPWAAAPTPQLSQGRTLAALAKGYTATAGSLRWSAEAVVLWVTACRRLQAGF